MSKRILIPLLASLMICLTLSSQAQFITIARKIKSMNSGDKDVATVILDAGAAKVYKAVTDTLGSDPQSRILKKDDLKRQVEFSHDPYTMSIKVDSLDNGVSQITVLSEHQGKTNEKTAGKAATVILAVCKKAGLHCTQKDQ